MLAVTVEGSPLEKRRNRLKRVLRRAPIVFHLLTSMLHNQLATSVRTWQTDDQRTKLSLAARRVNVRLEEAGRARVDLWERAF